MCKINNETSRILLFQSREKKANCGRFEEITAGSQSSLEKKSELKQSVVFLSLEQS